MPGRCWSVEREEIVRRDWPLGVDNATILGRVNSLPGPLISVYAMQRKAWALRVQRPADYIAAMNARNSAGHRGNPNPVPHRKTEAAPAPRVGPGEDPHLSARLQPVDPVPRSSGGIARSHSGMDRGTWRDAVPSGRGVRDDCGDSCRGPGGDRGAPGAAAGAARIRSMGRRCQAQGGGARCQVGQVAAERGGSAAAGEAGRLR